MGDAAILDTSGLMAFLDDEPGSAMVRSVIQTASVSTVSLAEAYSILAKRGQDGIAVLEEIRFLWER